MQARLVKDGIPYDLVNETYSDPRMPKFEQVSFKLKPKESHEQYTFFRTKKHLNEVKKFVAQYKDVLLKAQKDFDVPYQVTTAIISVESNFGRNTGNQLIVNRLSRVANIGEETNLNWNFERLKNESPDVKFEDVKARAEYLEKTFYPELKAVFEIALKRKVNIFEIKGSIAGAFGIPQFLPRAYFNFGVDGNNDGVVSLYQMEDAIFSVSKYLKENGWKNGIDNEIQKKVLWTYNKSEPYINTILHIAESA